MCHKCFMTCSLHSALVKWCRNISESIYRVVQIIASKQADLKSIIFFFNESLIVTVKQYYTNTVKCYKNKLSWSFSTTSCSDAHHAHHIGDESHTVNMHKWQNGAIEATEWSQQGSSVMENLELSGKRDFQNCKTQTLKVMLMSTVCVGFAQL